ncbi:hypothetical protein K438DRAFT_1879214 [Mycena galopus ATCC 62051]|nr:hypothetical protein K438DRAFT_1879214 [Mycena galopus ATCC 62051]
MTAPHLSNQPAPMALPPHFTTLDLTGRLLYDSYEDILKEQGIEDPELRREVSCERAERIWVQQDLDGCPQIADDHRILDWLDHAKNDALFGPVIERTRRIGTHTLQPPFLRKGWTPDTLKYGVLDESWTAIEAHLGHRISRGEATIRSTHVLTGPGGLEMERHLVYDYIGAV